VRIDAAFGSQFQRTVAIKNLNRVVPAGKALIHQASTAAEQSRFTRS
jgi:hypothetical protein